VVLDQDVDGLLGDSGPWNLPGLNVKGRPRREKGPWQASGGIGGKHPSSQRTKASRGVVFTVRIARHVTPNSFWLKLDPGGNSLAGRPVSRGCEAALHCRADKAHKRRRVLSRNPMPHRMKHPMPHRMKPGAPCARPRGPCRPCHFRHGPCETWPRMTRSRKGRASSMISKGRAGECASSGRSVLAAGTTRNCTSLWESQIRALVETVEPRLLWRRSKREAAPSRESTLGLWHGTAGSVPKVGPHTKRGPFPEKGR